MAMLLILVLLALYLSCTAVYLCVEYGWWSALWLYVPVIVAVYAIVVVLAEITAPLP